MTNQYVKIPFLCDALIDQDRWIGSDPVGHKCINPAEFELKTGHLICGPCVDLLSDAPERLSWPPEFGVEHQRVATTRILRRMAEARR